MGTEHEEGQSARIALRRATTAARKTIDEPPAGPSASAGRVDRRLAQTRAFLKNAPKAFRSKQSHADSHAGSATAGITDFESLIAAAKEARAHDSQAGSAGGVKNVLALVPDRHGNPRLQFVSTRDYNATSEQERYDVIATLHDILRHALESEHQDAEMSIATTAYASDGEHLPPSAAMADETRNIHMHVLQIVSDTRDDQRNDASGEAHQVTSGEVLAWFYEPMAAAHAERSSTLKPSSAPRDAPRAPSDCIVHWIAYLDAEPHGPSNSPPVDDVLHTLLASAKSMWMRHALTHADVRHYFLQAAETLEACGGDLHAATARQLHDNMGDSADLPYPLLHDNLYGRAFESFIADFLVKRPPASVMKAMQSVAAHLKTIFARGNEADTKAGKIASVTATKVREDRRFWFPFAPRLEALSQAVGSDEAEPALRHLLGATLKTGHDCVAMAYLAVKVSVAANESGRAPWMIAADKRYLAIQTAADRIVATTPQAPFMGAKWKHTSEGGLAARHHPKVIQDPSMKASIKPVTKNTPDFFSWRAGERTPSDAVSHQLTHGIPYASGASGSTNVLLHLFDHIASMENASIDQHAAMLGAMMFLTYDGGHSFHEALWVAQLTKLFPPFLGTNDEDSAIGTARVSDYAALPTRFDEDTAEHWDQAVDTAWRSTIAHFREHSHYARRAPRTTRTRRRPRTDLEDDIT